MSKAGKEKEKETFLRSCGHRLAILPIYLKEPIHRVGQKSSPWLRCSELVELPGTQKKQRQSLSVKVSLQKFSRAVTNKQIETPDNMHGNQQKQACLMTDVGIIRCRLSNNVYHFKRKA